MIAYVWLLLLAYEIDRSVTSRSIKSYECESSSSTLLASSHFDHIPFIPGFNALVSPSNIAWLGLITCGYWEVAGEVEPIALLHSNPWELLTNCLYCYAMLVDVVWVSEIHDRCEIVN